MADTPSPWSRRAFLAGLTAAAVAARSQNAGAQDAPSGTQPARLQPPQSQNAPVQTVFGQRGSRAQPLAEDRLAQAVRIREQAAELSAAIGPQAHAANGDERAEIAYALSFTKGLPHDYGTGLVDRNEDFEQFVAASNSGDPALIRALPLGPRNGFRTNDDGDPPLRGWETQAAGLAFDLVGHDAQSLTMPPAPRAGSAELTAELAEVYAQAVLRDQPLTTLRSEAGANSLRDKMIDGLSALPWFDGTTQRAELGELSDVEQARRRVNLSPQTAFRGLTPGETDGPYLSQLLLVGSPSAGRGPTSGVIEYGAQTIDQRVRQVRQTDFMTSWDEWIDIQNALAPAQGEADTGSRRFITTGRDLATYVHSDALYQPYLNACLILLSNGFPLDPSLPYQLPDARDHQQGFVLYSAQHVLSMLVEVCSRALKTVAFQKFNVHRRLRPEALAARVEKAWDLDVPGVTSMAASLAESPIANEVRRVTATSAGTASLLLPMAYAEGSPMHPSYGAGHGTVAGACVTILKTFFDHTRPFDVAGDASTAFVPRTDGSSLATVEVYDANDAPTTLTVEGELNKLAGNIAIGRDWAGVHYFSDYWQSLLLGEQIAMQIMREHMLTVQENFQLRVPTFTGERVWL